MLRSLKTPTTAPRCGALARATLPRIPVRSSRSNKQQVQFRRAKGEKVTVPNLLVSSVLSDATDSPTERRAIAAELMSLHNLLARSPNNINQLARQANATGEFPVEAREPLKFIRTVAMRIDDAIDGLM